MTINRESVIEKLKDLKEKGYIVPSEDMIKTNEEIEKIREVAKINIETLDLIEKNIKVGMTTDELNNLAHEFITSKGAESKFLNVLNPLTKQKYTKSISISRNNEASLNVSNTNRVLEDGDIVNVCVVIKYNGYSSDVSRMFMVGNVSDDAKKLVEVAKECTLKGIEAIKPWKRVGNVFDAIEKHAKDNGYSTSDFIGHGIGTITFEKLMLYNNADMDMDMVLVPGMALTLEPIIAQGNKDCYMGDDGCVYYTCDGKLVSQWAYTFLVTENGVEILGK